MSLERAAAETAGVKRTNAELERKLSLQGDELVTLRETADKLKLRCAQLEDVVNRLHGYSTYPQQQQQLQQNHHAVPQTNGIPSRRLNLAYGTEANELVAHASADYTQLPMPSSVSSISDAIAPKFPPRGAHHHRPTHDHYQDPRHHQLDKVVVHTVPDDLSRQHSPQLRIVAGYVPAFEQNTAGEPVFYDPNAAVIETISRSTSSRTLHRQVSSVAPSNVLDFYLMQCEFHRVRPNADVQRALSQPGRIALRVRGLAPLDLAPVFDVLGCGTIDVLDLRGCFVNSETLSTLRTTLHAVRDTTVLREVDLTGQHLPSKQILTDIKAALPALSFGAELDRQLT